MTAGRNRQELTKALNKSEKNGLQNTQGTPSFQTLLFYHIRVILERLACCGIGTARFASQVVQELRGSVMKGASLLYSGWNIRKDIRFMLCFG